MALEPGARLDVYEIVRPLGSGGMGEVWLATEVRLGRKVALKVLPAELTRDQMRVHRFEQEARAASALNHPNVCTIHALGETAHGQHYIAMEYVDGETLRQRLSSTRLTIGEALEIAIQVAAALSAAHAAGVIHRDIKPENVMLRPDGIAKVLDFGLAKLAPTPPDIAGGDATRTALKTDVGAVMGTVAYMSPEQARGQELDARSDTWSLGVMLYEMVAGRSPFAARSGTDVLAAILQNEPLPLVRFEPTIPQELQRIVTKTLRKDRPQRYQTVEDLLLDFKALRDDIASTHMAHSTAAWPSATAVSSAEQAPSSRSGAEYVLARVARHPWLSAAVVVSVLVSAVGLIWWVGHRTQEPERRAAREPVLTRLTANPLELPILSAMISPDGRYVAYADPIGIQVRIVDTGESQRLPDTKNMDVYGWTSDSTKVRASRCDGGSCVGWSISIVGNARYRADGTWPSGEVPLPMPRGSQFLRKTTSRELQMDPLDGSAPQVLAKNVDSWTPSADGRRVLFVNSNVIQSVPATAGPPVTVWKAPDGFQIMDLVDLPDRRMIVALARVRVDSGIALHLLQTDSTGAVVHAPRRLTEWRQELPRSLSSSADGSRVVFLSETAQSDVYVADLDMKSRTLSTPKRLTLDDRDDLPTDWSPDSNAVLFVSTRNGTADIFKQNIHSDTAEPLVTGPGDQTNARVASGGRWLLYFDGHATPPVRLMRVPVAGGTPQAVLTVSRESARPADRSQTVPLHCSVHGRCVMAERDGAGARVFSVDAERGKGAELGRFPADVAAATLSPDGQSMAFVIPGEDGRRNRIRFMSFEGKAAPDLVISEASWLSSHDALATGSGFLSVDVAAAGAQRRLLFIRPDGISEVLWSERGLRLIWAIPSPDGKHVALNAQPMQRDAWMVTDF